VSSLLRDSHVLQSSRNIGLGILTDLVIYTLIIPVVPYQLRDLGYDGIGAKMSWLYVAFVRPFQHPNRLVRSSLLVRDIGAGDATDSPLLRGLPQSQNPPPCRSNHLDLLASHVHGSSRLLGHDTRSTLGRRKRGGDLDHRFGARVSSNVSDPPAFYFVQEHH